MSAVWRWFTGLSKTSRLALGGGLIAYGLAGDYLTDTVGDAFGLTPTEQDKQKLKSMIPKISTVDKPGHTPQDKEIEAQLAELKRNRDN
ncbi:hypothetical protein TWF569_002145 [Orbilia oligospora]|uniref:Uncharacterized protein n=1 Tax=Orbilia oligospora TaxID=2813651 RepID=A0A7C8N096_ORBOL|nr:hypothetical protein TWF706_003349 [Orbilia oligospora]KAF3079450.1 hypothetical protein TWF706_003349 [Orbilia oligospora]KAF3080471.1 hypothetical protein TWF102_002166 [Orbilia oligospora]KAF3097555.1 hypothetical protein TWF103_009491 [Orbilia oligospora]KAF3122430.1 hypothetical protein TWF569_002145 [Orbilia oligospora]